MTRLLALLLCLALPVQAAELPARVRQAGKLVIATFPNYPPLTFRDPATNARMGFDVELGEAIGRVSGRAGRMDRDGVRADDPPACRPAARTWRWTA